MAVRRKDKSFDFAPPDRSPGAEWQGICWYRPITEKIQAAFFDIVNGRNPQYAEWLTQV